MALSSLSTVNQALANIQDTARGAPMPLDAIEARRAARAAEQIAQHEAQSKRIKAMEDAASGQATRAATAHTATVFEQVSKANPITAEPGSKEYLKQGMAWSAAALNSGNEDAIKAASDFLAKTSQIQGATELDLGTLKGVATAAEAEADMASAASSRAAAQLNTNLAAKTTGKLSPDAVAWAQGFVMSNDPGKQGWLSIFKPDMKPEEIQQSSMELARLYDTAIRQQVASGATVIDHASAEQEALRLFQLRQGQQAPVQPQGATGTGQGGVDPRFDFGQGM